MKKAWDKKRIIDTLRNLHKAGKDLSYNALAKKTQPLVSAAAYHFGSYRRAIEKAGIDYAEVLRRPRWNKQLIIQLIKKAKRSGEDLHWSAVTRRRDELGKAAFASLQPRLFGSWDRALHAAGLDAAEVSRYRRWDRASIAAELKQRFRDGDSLNSGALQREDPGIHAAAVRHFGSYDNALKSAGLDPSQLRQRRRWTKPDVIKELKAFKRHFGDLGDGSLRQHAPALYGAALRFFNTLAAARKATTKPARAS
ncbi:MAG: hypothetical protein ACM359_20095 [Bacillota bacterium]